MKATLKPSSAILILIPAVLLALAAITSVSHAATNTWTGPTGGDWSTPGNWTPSGPPGTNDEARFYNTGAVPDATIDNIVSTDTTIQRLWIGQTNNILNLQINAGVTLTIGGTNDNGY